MNYPNRKRYLFKEGFTIYSSTEMAPKPLIKKKSKNNILSYLAIWLLTHRSLLLIYFAYQ